MSLFGFNYNKEVDGKPEWLQKVTDVFGYMDYKEQIKDTGYGISDQDEALAASGENGDVMVGAQFYGNMKRYLNFDEPTKPQKLRVYRSMADYPEIKYALSMICDELLNHSDLTGNVGTLEIVNEKLLENVNKRDNLKKEWDYIFDDVLNFKDEGRDAILSFLISGELMFEKIINPDRRGEGIKRIKRLKPDNVFPVWSNDKDSIIEYRIKDINNIGGGTIGHIPKSQIAYTSWDQYAENPETGEVCTLSYLEPVKKVWRQLQLLEEALIIYRIVRAPERRIFKIATGNLPPDKAEAYMKQMMRKYRQKKIYNTSTSEIDGQSNIMSMLEDYWLPVPQDGNQSDIDTLSGGENLGEITDVNYFLEKLYRALEIPSNRRLDVTSGNQQYNEGDIGEISWQEVKFSKMVNRIRRKMVIVIMDVFKTHLQLKGFWEKYNLKESDFRIELNKNNYFEELKRAKVEETRLNNWGSISTYVGDVFSKEWAVKHFLKISDEEWNINKEMIITERLEGEDEVDEGGGL
jgi:hypothetical protein